MDKLKDMAGKATGGSSSGSTGSSGSSGDKYEQYTTKGVDMATDKVGMGDKYDSQISEQANKQVKNYTSGQSK